MPLITVAKYSGVCSLCLQEIKPGQYITKNVDEAGELLSGLSSEYWNHAHCPDPLETKAPICPKCFLTKPCDCDD